MYNKEKRIPTLVALLIVFGGLGAALSLDSQTQTLFTKAQTGNAPQDVHVTNISDNSFTVSWLTETPVIGLLTVTHDNQKTNHFDDLDSDGTARPRTTHFSSVKNLTPDNEYTIRIQSGSGCKKESDCPTIVQKTGTQLPAPASLPPLRGTVLTKDNTPADGALVYLTVGKSMPLSGRTDSSGRWVIPLTNVRTQDLLSRYQITDSDTVSMSIKHTPPLSSEATIGYKKLQADPNVPPLTLGNTYNFLENTGGPDAVIKHSVLGTGTDQSPKPGTVDILFPKVDNDTTPDTRPRLRGVAPANKKITLTLDTKKPVTVTADSKGVWEWRPPSALTTGTHTLKIQGYDAGNTYQTVSRRFVVLKSGERVLGESTPSSTITLAPSPSPTLAAGPSSTPSPTSSLSPTATPTPSILLTPTPTTIQPTSAPPRSGSTETTFIALAAGAAFLAASVVLLFLP